MKEFTKNLMVDNLIVHDVPKKFSKKFKKENPDALCEEIVLSDVPTGFDNDLIKFFHAKIASTIGSTNAFEVEFDPSLVENKTREAICKYFEIGKKTSFPVPESEIINITQEIAKALHAIQSAQNPGGIILFIPCHNKNCHGLAILKVEREDGVRIQQKMAGQGKKTFEVEHIKDLMLTNKTKLFKIVLFYQDGENIKGFVCDQQQGVIRNREVANFFLIGFLGCKLKEEPHVSTKKFYEAVTTYINDKHLNDSEKLDIRMHLISTLTNNATVINVLEFARNFLPNTDMLNDNIQDFMNMIKQKKIPESFPKDIQLIAESLKKVKYELECGIKIIGLEEIVKNHLLIESLDDGKTKFEVIDHIRKVE